MYKLSEKVILLAVVQKLVLGFVI